MARLHLTDAAVRALKPTDKYVTYWDDTTPGFGIRVGKRTKTWTVMRGKNRERVRIGHYGEGGLSLAQARAKAKKLLAETPEPKAPTVTFRGAKDRFVEENYRDAKPRTKKEAKRVLEKHFGALTARALPDITDADIEAQLEKLSDRPSEQLHAFRIIRCFFRWTIKPPRRYIRHSPMEGYEAPSKDRKRSRVLSDDELVRLWQAATDMEWDLPKLLILWGTRKTETASIRRDWVVDGVLTIPGTHTKNKRAHAIPLLPMAKQILDKQPDAGQYFFPGRWDKDQPFNEGSWGKLKVDLMKKSGIKNWQLRDIRRTFRSTMARLGVPRDVAEVLINHAPPVLDEIYDRYDRLAEKRDALQRYELHLASLLKAANLLAA